ncbi:hypothetical protein AWM70_12660 [Paenibacillus yonginensis]|uniref:Uncharacterized protein n=1 Tax=Paenibacillus yonginensis TaxID=1462996 RepID=A0A1B1N1R5_9BACL|nr:hypothetical protein [Paenibacillus yonginensis]ANS75355.1 hypothetical protein AWM70_12660 [Paenibacillus yonginensis]
MNAIIISKKASPYVLEAIGNSDISFEKVGRFTPEQFMEFCQAAARINVASFITDLDCADSAAFMEGIRQYQTYRSQTPIIVIGLDRPDDDGLVHRLAEMGIIVITTVPGTSPKSIVSALAKLQPGSLESATALEAEDPDVQLERVKDRIYRYTSRLKAGALLEADLMDMELPELPVQERIILQDRIIGTIVVAVAGVESKVGSTHFSILIANYLTRKGYRVALKEANASQDFNRIEQAYEGMKGFNSPNTSFTINKVDYFKSNDREGMSKLVGSGYNYLVLDIGCLEESDWKDEFYRAGVQFVVGAGSEWRQPKIVQFREKHKNLDQSNWIYSIPFIEKLSISDVRKELPGNLVYRIPPHPDPYKHQSDTDAFLNNVLKKYMGEKKKSSTKTVLYAVISLCVVIIVILVIMLILNM